MSREKNNESDNNLAEKAFLDFVIVQARNIDGDWEILLNQSKDSYLEFKKKFSIFDRIFSALLFVNPSIRDVELKKKNNLLEALFEKAPRSIQFKCSNHLKSTNETLLEPAIPIEDDIGAKEQQQTLLIQQNCEEMLDLRFAIDLSPPSVGSEMYVRYAEASCNVCKRNHTIWPKNLSLRFYRPSYLRGSVETVRDFIA